MNRRPRHLAAAAAALLVAAAAGAELPDDSADGWHTWRVTAVAEMPEWCCFTWSAGRSSAGRCDLDSRRGGWGSGHDRIDSTGQVQIYALLDDGRATDLRALSPRCPVTGAPGIRDLGIADTASSVAWLAGYLDTDLASDAIAGIAAHAGAKARDVLVETARTGATDDAREESVFWMAQLRIDETADEIRRLMFDDASPDMRKHAAFAYAQSDADDRPALLIRQGSNDADAEVRGEAWFWLAETGAPEAERAIRRAIRSDADPGVREQAVFALSQLPEGRAVASLTAIIEDAAVDAETRKQALFWLAQVESDAALDYIERLLTG